jgi:hypothetical protein
MFQNKTQVDVLAILMLLGEASLWRVLWSRLRSRRAHWSHFMFAASPGWAPLAGSLFAGLASFEGSPNLVFDRAPEGSNDSKVLLTNLNSGATHQADNTMLQNIWQTWNRGYRRQRNSNTYDITREIGVVDVNLDQLVIETRWSLYIHLLCLSIQFGGALALGSCGMGFELLAVLFVAFAGQSLLLAAIVPRKKVWNKAVRQHRPAPLLLHKGCDSTGTLILRSVRLGGKSLNMEEFCWESQIGRDRVDTVKMIAAGSAFAVFVLQIILVGWMTAENRTYYLVFGILGLAANTTEVVSKPDWGSAAGKAFTGSPCCAPEKSSLMSSVAMLIAGKFPAALATSQQLYPANSRFDQSLQDLQTIFDELVCQHCRAVIRGCPNAGGLHKCLKKVAVVGGVECSYALAKRARHVDSKQISDGLAAVCHLLCSLNGSISTHQVKTSYKIATTPIHTWDT